MNDSRAQGPATTNPMFQPITKGNETVRFHGIPFSVTRKEDGAVAALPWVYGNPSGWDDDRLSVQGTFSALFFLGMVTQEAGCSEWWGLCEREHDHSHRLFIGDRLGFIIVHYADDTQALIPALAGVNVWPYDLVTPPQPDEKDINNFWGPYPEPFESDAQARALRDASLRLMDTGAEKPFKYIFCFQPQAKPIRRIALFKNDSRHHGFVVSAITGVAAGTPLDPAWRAVDIGFFTRREYFPAADRLARRLYQFDDEMPAHDPLRTPAGYTGPTAGFAGNGLADVFTNVYVINQHDIRTQKVDADGRSHTSTKDLPSFGCYVGLGTWRITERYYAQMWSRDVGRELIELIQSGESLRALAAGTLHEKYLYDGCLKYDRPHWKRLANETELNGGTRKAGGKENDGHASLMLFYINLFLRGVADVAWLRQHRAALADAIDWFLWQMEHPAESAFDEVLWSESEASSQKYGGQDLFSNTLAYYASKGYEKMALAMEDKELAAKCRRVHETLRCGIAKRFLGQHPRHGTVFMDTIDDCWTWEYKRFAPLFVASDVDGYDLEESDPEWFAIAQRTLGAQKEDYYSPAAGRQMGYGQGYLTETCLMLDAYPELTACVEQATKFCYHHTDFPYIVPEGVIMHPSGRYWFRNSDLSNAVQQGEIVKCGRLMLGLDDLDADGGLRLIPRLPDTWNRLWADRYTVVTAGRKRVPVSMTYERTKGGYRLEFRAPTPVLVKSVRLGPFPEGATPKVEGGEISAVIHRNGRSFVKVAINRATDALTLSACALG